MTTNKLKEAVNNERNSSFESNPTVVLDISDMSTDDSIFGSLRSERPCLAIKQQWMAAKLIFISNFNLKFCMLYLWTEFSAYSNFNSFRWNKNNLFVFYKYVIWNWLLLFWQGFVRECLGFFLHLTRYFQFVEHGFTRFFLHVFLRNFSTM